MQPQDVQGEAGSAVRQLLQILFERSESLRAYIDGEIPPRFRSSVSAEDILQEVWIAAFRADHTAIRDWDGWITVATRSKLIEVLRNARTLKRGGGKNRVNVIDSRMSSYVDLFARIQDDTRTPSRELSAKEACRAVSIALAALPENKRQAVHLCHIAGLTRREIASRMGRSEAAVNSLICAGMRQLRVLVGDAAGILSGAGSSDIRHA